MSKARQTGADLTGVVRELREQLSSIDAEAARYRRLADNASDLLVEVDESGRLLFVSANCSRVIGRPAEVLAGKTPDESGLRSWLHPDDTESLRHAFHAVSASPEDAKFQCRVLHGDGSWHWLECSAKRYCPQDGGTHLIVIARNVTERIEAEQRLRQSEERFRVLAETTHDYVSEVDEKGRAVYVSPNSVQVLGYTPEEMLGTTAFDYMHEDDYERATSMFLDASKELGPLKSQVFRFRHRDGSTRWVEGSGVTYRTTDGELRFVTISRDVTESRAAEAERVRLEQRMQQAQKLESLGVLAGGIAHDFNNLLTPILGDASLALADLASDSPLRSRMERIVTAAQRAAVLTRQMLAYAGTESLHAETLDLTRVVREMAQLIESAATRKAVLEYDLADELPPIQGDSAQISQVAMNLVSNASEALGDGTGRITVRTGHLEVDRAMLSHAFPAGDLHEGTYAYLEVTDTGEGMDARTRARVFDPFFSTRFTGRGLGLAAVLGILRAHRGAVEVDSAPGLGTRVRALFPRWDGTSWNGISSTPSDGSWRGSGLVLVVDDDEAVRALASDTLERAGFDVLVAADGARAVEIFEERGADIRAVLLDRTMPGVGGEETFERIRGIRPEVPVVLVSGYSERSASERFVGKGLAGFLQKPFLPSMLVGAIREALGQSSETPLDAPS
jgi:PAS domain S-box-containing protein